MEENSENSSRNKVPQFILSVVKSKQVKSRISEDEDGNSEGTLQRYRKSRRNVDPALLLATKIRVKTIPYTQNQNYQKVNNLRLVQHRISPKM